MAITTGLVKTLQAPIDLYQMNESATRKYLIEYSPTIVHFSGHGAGADGLCFEDEEGYANTVSGDKLAKLFHLVSDTVQCVVLNACLSEMQAKAISEHIDFVIGMRDEIGDAAAIKFAQGFYEAIWGGRSYDKAFKFGCSAIDTASIPEEDVPVLKLSPRLGGTSLPYSEATQGIENFILGYLNGNADQRVKSTLNGKSYIEEFREQDRTRPHFLSATVASVTTVEEVYQEVLVKIRIKDGCSDQIFYLKPEAGSYLVDWEASVGRWPMPFTTFKALGSEEPMKVRVVAQLSDYFNYGFEKDQFVSVTLWHISGESIHGYIKRDPFLCDMLVKFLYDGKRHRMILEITPEERQTSCVWITNAIASSWIMPASAD